MTDVLRPIKSVVKQTPLWPLLRPRRFHAYGVGASKTGTTSIAKMFGEKYRVGHEQHLEKTVSLIRGKMNGSLSWKEILSALKDRENQMRLECESNSLLAYLSSELAELFPKARFILTVREPYSWLSSNLKQHLSSPYSQLLSPYKRARDTRRKLYGVLSDDDFPEEEEALRRKGVWNIEAYLRYWSHQNRVVLNSVPDDRLLIIETTEISSSLNTISEFLEIPPDGLSREQSHTNSSKTGKDLIKELDRGYVDRQIDRYCSDMIRTLKAKCDDQLRF